jgi:hypothetical protein
MNEGKKGFRAKKHRVASVEPSKPRNFVAKNAKMGGAGAHKDKKKAAKQGDVKHKKNAMSEAISTGNPEADKKIAELEEHLQSMLEIEMLVERQINETGLDPLRRMKAIQYIAQKTGWEINYLELASDEELMDLYVKVKKGLPTDEGSNYYYNPDRDAEQQWDAARQADQDFRNRERNAGVENERDRPQEIGRTYFKIPYDQAKDAKVLYGLRWDPEKKLWFKPRYNTSGRTHSFHIQQLEKQFPRVKIGESRDMCNVCGQTPCNCTHIEEGAKVDRQAMHITKSMMKRHGMSRDEAEAAAWAHIKHPKKKKKKAHEGWTTDTLAAQLFEQELTYEDKLNNMLAKEAKKK